MQDDGWLCYVLCHLLLVALLVALRARLATTHDALGGCKQQSATSML